MLCLCYNESIIGHTRRYTLGFLNRTVFAKRLNKSNLFALAIIAGIISCGLAISPSTFAEEVVDNYGLYTDSDGVRWEWEVVSDSENTAEPQKINLMFYDKPENLTTVTVPSYNDTTTITGVTPASDTYYVRNADQESQDTRFTNPDPARRTANQADVTVLDMTNTSKVQIMGVKPIINPETEVELIFGENMVIGDGVEITKSAVVDVCTSMVYYDSYRYKCAEFEERDFNEVQDSVEGWNDKTIPEKQSYQLSLTDLVDCKALSYFDFLNPPFWGYGSYSYDSTKCYARIVSRSETIGGVFSNYRLKLTNLQNVKYFGWFAFSNSVLNESNYSVSIKANQTAGEGVFEGTNVKNVSFEGTTTYPAMFRNCSDLESIDFGNVETVSYSTFENSPVGTSLDLSTTNIKTVLGKAFKNSGISELNLGSVEKLGFEAELTNKGGVIVNLGGKDKKNGLLLEAHTDTLGGMVATIKSNGRLQLTNLGGMNPNNAETENVRIVTKFDGIYEGTFQLNNASIHDLRRSPCNSCSSCVRSMADIVLCLMIIPKVIKHFLLIL